LVIFFSSFILSKYGIHCLSELINIQLVFIYLLVLVCKKVNLENVNYAKEIFKLGNLLISFLSLSPYLKSISIISLLQVDLNLPIAETLNNFLERLNTKCLLKNESYY